MASRGKWGLNSERKIKNLAELADLCAALRRQGKVIVHCHGVFDLLHPGHLKHFASARRQGDVLVVTVTADRFVKRGPGRPLFRERLRAASLAALEAVDFVAIDASPTAVSSIKQLKPHVYAKGPDYRDARRDVTGKIIDEERAVRSVGGRLYISDDETYSSTSLINNYLDVFPDGTRRYLADLARRFPYEAISEALGRVNELRVLVIGDAVIDQYDYCSQMGKSGKEPLVVSKHVSAESFAGGALATANHAASISAKVELLCVLGRKDSWREFIEDRLAAAVKPTFFFRHDAGTTIKKRYVSTSRNQKLFEIYFMNDDPIDRAVERRVMAWFKQRWRAFDLVIVNDFGHGFITARIIDTVCRLARKLAINVQTNSANAGFNLVTKYPRADFVCVDEVELRYAAHDRLSDLRAVARRIQRQLRSQLIVTTRGHEGSLTLSQRGGFIATPAFASQVIDPVGAGDAFFAFAAPCYAAGLPVPLVPFIGNVAGSLATQIVGNREAVQLPDALKFIARLLK